MADDYLIYIMKIPVYLSTVKNNSLKIMMLIPQKGAMKQLCGDIANYFQNAYTNEKVFVQRARQ